jgi:hypothetical protein
MNSRYKHLFCQIIFNLFLLCTLVLAQIDTVALSYYPLQHDNFWLYRRSACDWGLPNCQVNYYSIFVAGDTVLPNEQTYKLLVRHWYGNEYSHPQYQRIDSLSGNLYIFSISGNKDYLLDSLYSQVGDTCTGSRFNLSETGYDLEWTVLDSTGEDIVLDSVRPIKMFSSFRPGYAGMTYNLAKGIGFYESVISGDFVDTYDQLIYAKICGIEYGDSVTSIESEDDHRVVNEYILTQNHPNPFNNQSHLSIILNQSGSAELDLYNILGEHQTEIYKGNISAGINTFTIDGTNLSSGIYFYVLRIGAGTLVKKCLLIK